MDHSLVHLYLMEHDWGKDCKCCRKHLVTDGKMIAAEDWHTDSNPVTVLGRHRINFHSLMRVSFFIRDTPCIMEVKRFFCIAVCWMLSFATQRTVCGVICISLMALMVQ